MFTYAQFNDWWLIDITKSKSYSKIAKLRNNVAFMSELMREIDMWMHAFSIKGVPDSGSERVIKESILWYGGYVPFREKDSDAVLTLPGTPDGSGLNMYADYAGAHVFGANGFTERVPLLLPGSDKSNALQQMQGRSIQEEEPRGVLVRANDAMFPFINYIYAYAEAISDTMRSLDVARQHIKMPYIIVAKQALIPTIIEQMEKVRNNEDTIISSGNFPVDSINVLPLTGIPESINAASTLIDWYKQQFREMTSYDNLGGQVDKKGENLVTAEITYNQQATDASMDGMIEWLNDGHNYANALFGTQLKAVRNNDISDDDITGDDRQRGGDLSEDGDGAGRGRSTAEQ